MSTTTPRKRRAGTVLYDCGKHGLLTAAEAAKIARCHTSRIKQRARDGIAGDALVATSQENAK